LAAKGLGSKFDFVVTEGFVHLVDDAHDGLGMGLNEDYRDKSEMILK
jgi:hypothetical protein